MSKRKRLGKAVVVTWIDSGMTKNCSEHDAIHAPLPLRRLYGRVVFEDKERLVLAMDTDQDDEGEHGVIWQKSIQKVERLK